jgi:Fur family transcriptional regulator, ferric uptake regulator
MPHNPSHANAQFDAALDLLRANHQRVTGPRKAILGILTREHGPFTAEELHKRMKRGRCDLVTVYRSLAAMEESSVVRRCDFGDGAHRYEINTGEHHHHHIVCRSCHEARTLDMCVADGLERMARQMGYAKVTHLLEIFGVCPRCQAEQDKPPAHHKD